MLTEFEIKELIKETKNFWKVENFEEEILNWNFAVKHPNNLIFNIGHPIGSHKGPSLGDMLPYTILPELIKNKFGNDATVTIPKHFSPIFKYNSFIDDFDGPCVRWGSLGTWGNTVQRTCNVWGFHTFEFRPNIYYFNGKKKGSILFTTNSKTGGRIGNLKNIEQVVEELKLKYRCVQLLSKDDVRLSNVHEYVYNISDFDNLIEFVASFEVYIGAQNSIYHLAKALDLQVIGILPENVSVDLMILPLLTQVNHLELEMLTDKERERSERWKNWIKSKDRDFNSSHHAGWLYPDSVHLTSKEVGTDRIPSVSVDNILLALDNKIYPYNDDRLWDVDKHRELWSEK